MQAGIGGTSFFDGIKLTRRHFMMFFLLLLGTFFDQMDLYNMSFIGPALIKNWGLTLEQLARINSTMIFVMLFGGLLGGWMSDKLGRRTAVLTGAFIFSVASIGNGLAWDYYSFLVTRCITGIGIAMLIAIEGGYMAEITPAESRGKMWGLVFGTALFASPVTAFIAKTIIPMYPFGWRIVFFIGGLGIVIFILGLFYLKESPRWLVTKGRLEEAKKVFRELTGQELNINPADVRVEERAGYLETFRVMFHKHYIKQSLVLCLVYFIAITAAFLFISWAPTLLTQEGMDLALTLRIGFIISIGMPIGGILAAFVSDKGGRKIPLSVFLFMYGTFAFIYGNMADPTYIMLFGFLLAVCHMGFFTTLGAYGGESFPTYVRGTSVAFLYVLCRIGPAIGIGFVPKLYGAAGYTGYFYVVGAMLIALGLIIFIFGRSTAGKSLEELHSVWNESRKLQDVKKAQVGTAPAN